MKKFLILILFVVLNFSALGLGTILMDNGPTSQWYLYLNKAPWSPPGWVFGVAWTTVMLTFSVYMTALVAKKNGMTVLLLYAVQLVLNISWNWFFFNQHLVRMGQIVLILLLLTVLYIGLTYIKKTKLFSLFILPYFLWLLVANSLNLYILLCND